MERQIERGCGLDVHRDTVAACVRVPGARGEREQHVRTFGTTAAELLRLRDWLGAHGVTHVAMESTGVYWKPVFYVLEDACTCLLVNAAHIKQVPGTQDGRAGLHLDRASAGAWAAAGQFRAAGGDSRAPRPDAPPQGVDPRTAARRQPAAQAAAGRGHQAGVRRDRHPRGVGPGDAGRAGAGHHRRPRCWPTWRGASCAQKLADLREAWPGGSARTTRFWSGSSWPIVDYLDEAIDHREWGGRGALWPRSRPPRDPLDTVPGIARRTAEVIVAEIGVDMSSLSE